MSTEDNPITKAITAFKEDRTVENVLVILDILKDSTVWIPCHAVMAESDQEQLEKLMKDAGDDPEAVVGKTFEPKEEIRMVPDILENADGLFFPVFSSQEEMGEYGEHFSKVEKPFMEALVMARNNERDLVGIVVNAFTDPLGLPWNVLEIIENPGDGEES